MNPDSPGGKRWFIVALYAVAMAWVEAAVVYYLRTLVNRIKPYQAQPLPIASGLGEAELIREAATLVMLFTVGWLAGSTWRRRAGYSLITFGIWDVFYYIFLRVLTGWPNSLFDWDILFLIPLPWWGPVLAPVAIAAAMICFGSIVAGFDSVKQPLWPGTFASCTGILGIALSLYVFMSDALLAPDKSPAALRNLLPTQFDWLKFSIALLLLAVPILDVTRQLWKRRGTIASVSGAVSEGIT